MGITRRRENLYCAAFSLLFGFCHCYLYLVEKDVLHGKWGAAILMADVVVSGIVCFLFLTRLALPWVARTAQRAEVWTAETNRRSDVKYFLLVALVLFLLWTPVFLAYYPGIFAYDVYAQIPLRYTTHHPLLHTLYLQFFYYIVGKHWAGDPNTGIAAASLVQMALLSLMVSFTHLYLRKVGVRKRYRALLVAFTGIFPVFPMMAISTTKDILFAGIFAVLFTLLCWRRTFADAAVGRRGYAVLYVLVVAGVILMRNNGLYPVLGLTACLAVAARKSKTDRKLLCYTVAGLLIGGAVNAGLQYGLQAEPGSKNEMLNVPYQQIACAYQDNKEDMTDAEKAAIIEILPDVERYNPYISDNIKATARGADNIGDLLTVYLKTGLKYPQSYLKGFFQLNGGYLSIVDTTVARVYYGEESAYRIGIIPSFIQAGFGVTRESRLPVLENLYEKLFTNNDYQYVFGLNLLCSPALYLWLTILLAFCCAVQKVPGTAPMFSFLFVLILTLFAGPCVLVRYALPYILCLPPLAACVQRTRTLAAV